MLQNERQVLPMKISYVAKDKAFIINADKNEKSKARFIAEQFSNYTVIYYHDSNTIGIYLDTDKAITPQKEDVKATYAKAKEVWKETKKNADKVESVIEKSGELYCKTCDKNGINFATQDIGGNILVTDNKVHFSHGNAIISTTENIKEYTKAYLEGFDEFETFINPPKPAKKVRRRNKQLGKALNLMGKAGKEEKIINSLFHRGGTLAFVA